ncbi:hypothetical protein OG601_30680 [Streptomyces sp. NBC_01239]|uniref:hypothetical protein n=1 Tax=Streptomyces sp. NBC_01239 TaxID=2903792 RepID=UPI002258A94C|nr:hypothetical protein [Streptomyces sp. NBC_01239]MCX4814972.1 hypothetical protein [Streptomyces sp. NBC_01239]
MRRTALALAVVGLVGAAGPAVAADPGAEVSPSSVRAGGSVTVSVTCEGPGGTVAETIDATSQGFDDGTVQLQRVPGNDDRAAATAYRGTARISTDGVERDSAWTVDGTCPAPPGGQGRPWSATFSIERGGGRPPCQEPRGEACGGDVPAAVQRGVQAGEGGTFTDSVPALVAGGVLIAAAFGGAVYRLRRRTPGH